jgi:predicted ABC-type sugar transport system permease subunit
MRYIRDTDELQRRIELEAVSISTAFVSFAYLTGGFLQAARVIDVRATDAMLWVFPLTCLAYGVVKIVVSRRYS